MADEVEAIRQLKARYCRFLDAKDAESWRSVFTTDVVVSLDMAVSTGGADPQRMKQCYSVSSSAPRSISYWCIKPVFQLDPGFPEHPRL